MKAALFVHGIHTTFLELNVAKDWGSTGRGINDQRVRTGRLPQTVRRQTSAETEQQCFKAWSLAEV